MLKLDFHFNIMHTNTEEGNFFKKKIEACFDCSGHVLLGRKETGTITPLVQGLGPLESP